jgi:DNA-binding CsgD family transcriptional regulator
LANDPVVIHLIPVTGEARDIFGGGFGVLVITAVSAPAAPTVALIRGLFDLTPAEARVASGIAEGLTVDQIAGQHGVTAETVRVQIKAVFAKTGVSRQSQLAALLAAVPKIPMG